MKRKTVAILSLLLMSLCTGCLLRPYDVPEFAEIQHHETGYLIPLEGNTSKQAKFESEEALAANKVGLKRVQIPHRWVQTGRMPNKGQYVDTVRLVVVDRSPVTREWTADTDSGTNQSNQAIWLESRDSIGFSLGFNCTAFVDEPDSTKFLYWYPTAEKSSDQTYDKSVAELDHVMDQEIRARVQMLSNAVAAQYDLDDLRAKKAEIMHAVRNGVPEMKDAQGNIIQERLVGTIEHFKERGITITALGQFGGFAYEQPKIQSAIDETFIAQQEKVRTEAAFEAQGKINEKITLAAEAEAEKARLVAKGKADAITLEAEAQASAIRQVAEATKAANGDPTFIQVKQMEIDMERAKQWDGKYPVTWFGGNSLPGMLMQMPVTAEQ